MEQIFFRALYALLQDKQVVKITTTRVGDKLTLLINKDNKLITMTGNPEEVDNAIINHLKVNTTPTEQEFNVTVQDAPDSDDNKEDISTKSSSKKETPKTGKKSKSSKKKPAYLMKMAIGEELQPVVGKEPLPRTEVMKKLWEYIKEKGLQDKKEKKTIHADETLQKIFGGKKSVSMFEMTKLINKHLTMVKVETKEEKADTKSENSKEIEEAKAKLKEFTERMDLGKRAMEQGNYEEAMKVYELAMASAPEGNTKASAQLEKAKLALQKQKDAEKKKEFDDLMALGKKQREERKYEDSLDTFKKAQALLPDNADSAKQVVSGEKWLKHLNELLESE